MQTIFEDELELLQSSFTIGNSISDYPQDNTVRDSQEPIERQDTTFDNGTIDTVTGIQNMDEYDFDFE